MNVITNELLLKTFLTRCELQWGLRPVVTLACAGASDEHWQIWHPEDYLSPLIWAPRFTMTDGTIELHPDNPVQEVIL